MRRVIFLIFVISISNIFSDEIKYKINKVTQVWNSKTGDDSEHKLITLYPGDVVIFNGDIASDPYSDNFRIRIQTDDDWKDIGWIDHDELERIGENDILPESITSKRWILSYYQDVLKSRDKETLFIYEPFWIDWYNDDPNPNEYNLWWQIYTISTLNIKDNFIHFLTSFQSGRTHYFLNKEITGDMIITKSLSNRISEIEYGFMKKIGEKKEYKLILKEDGDYLKIFLNNESEENLLQEFISIDENFYNALYKVIKDDKPYDYTPEPDYNNINWPKRASEK